MKCVWRVVGWLALLVLPARAGNLPAMVVVTEDARPLHYLWQGQLQGEAPQFVQQLMRRAGLHYSQQVYPWARAYMMAGSLPNVLIYSMARTPEREPQFHWIGKLLTVQYAMYALQSRSDIRARSVDELRAYRIGVTASDVRANWLRDQGLRDASADSRAGLDVADDSLSNLRKLMQGRVDMVPTSAVGLKSFCQSEGVDCSRFRRVMVLPFSVDLYLAASLKTAPPAVASLRRAYHSMVRDGRHHQILAPYLDSSEYALVTGKMK